MKDSITKYKIFNSKLTTIVSISMVLFLVGIIVLGLKIGNTLSDYVRENYTISIEIKDDAEEKEIATLNEILRGQDYAKKVSFISKEQALKDLESAMGEDPVEFLDYNPLKASFVVNLKSEFTDNDKIENVEKSIKEYRIVDKVFYQKQFINEVNHNIHKVSLLFLIVAAVLFFISFVLINNTLRLLIYSDRFLINTMKLVGATRSFIRRPYLKKGVMIGILAAILAIGYMLFFAYILRDQLSLFVDYSDHSILIVVVVSILISGIVISWLSTYFAVNKFLSREEKELYYI